MSGKDYEGKQEEYQLPSTYDATSKRVGSC